MSAEQYTNDSTVEIAWAIKAYEEAELHFNLITSVNPFHLKLSPYDDMVYEKFRSDFPDFSIEQIDEETLKSPEAKKVWRKFCNQFEGKVDSFNYGTLLRLNPYEDYSEKNSVFATRIQFLAIEVARNREGFNKKTFDNFLKDRISAQKMKEVVEIADKVSIS